MVNICVTCKSALQRMKCVVKIYEFQQHNKHAEDFEICSITLIPHWFFSTMWGLALVLFYELSQIYGMEAAPKICNISAMPELTLDHSMRLQKLIDFVLWWRGRNSSLKHPHFSMLSAASNDGILGSFLYYTALWYTLYLAVACILSAPQRAGRGAEFLAPEERTQCWSCALVLPSQEEEEVSWTSLALSKWNPSTGARTELQN